MAEPERCPACGATLREGVAYCVSCGLPHATASASPPSAPS
ncbi:MAG: zinc-ribbon domain-containing protein, partial [Ktedonobacterales bacterium]